uniref:Cilia and flagella associated protein 70 n=1 Tax=Aquila chrysaetos chrysaetos TaxID=223781 RepID=A0A663FDX1_AQUCH
SAQPSSAPLPHSCGKTAKDLTSEPCPGDVSVTLVRAEYNGVILGDSSKTDVLPDGTANYNFMTSFECSPDGPNSLDDIAQKPVLLTVIEVLQREQRQKEKTVPLGQAVVDLLPLLQGQCSFKVSAPLYAVPTSPLESLHPEAKGGLEVTVCTKEPLLSAAQLSNGNLLSVTLEAAYSVPEAFAATGPLQNYMACLQVPAAGEKEFPLLFKNGILKLAGEKEPLPRPKKWPLANIMAPGALSIPNSFIVGGPYEDEDGELNKREDREFRIQAESTKRIVWDMERRCYLDPAAVHRVVGRNHPRIITVRSVSQSLGLCFQGDEDKQIFFHGVAYVNMVPLLCPGVKQIRGAFRVFTYQDSEVFEKTKCQHSVFRDLRTQLSLTKEGSWTPGISTPLSRAVPSKTRKEDKEKITKDKDSNRRVRSRELYAQSFIMPVRALDSTTLREQCLSSQQYIEAGTFLVMDIKLDKALVPKRLQEELTRRVKQMIPPRPPLPPRTAGAKKAVEDYHNHVTSIAVAILSEYHELFGKQLPDQGAIDHQTLEEQKRQLNFELNSSGKYFAFKEQLKYAVVKIVREKYLKTTAFETQEQFQSFLSELYVYLMDEMHIALNQLLSEEAASPAPPSRTTEEQLWLFAREAEVNKDYKLASLYHQQVKEPLFFPHWLDYGGVSPTPLPGACKANLSNTVPSLLLCGIVAVMLEHYEEAEIFFEDACCLEPSSIVAWTLSGLFYELQNNNIQAEMAFREAKKLLQAQLAKERSIPEAAEGEEGKKHISAGCVRSPSPGPGERLPGNTGKTRRCPSTSKEGARSSPPLPPPGFYTVLLGFLCPCQGLSPCSCFRNKKLTLGLMETHFLAAPSPVSGLSQPPCTIFMKAVEFLMKVNAVQFVHRALAHELLSLQGGPSCAYYLALAQTYLLKEDLSKCEECLCEAIRIDYMNPNVWAQKGHLCYLKRDFGEAKECYERTISFVEDAADMHFVYLRLGSIYLEEKEYGRAKQTYLLACKNSASCLTWLGVGIACYRLEEMVEAEDALSEANALSNTNAEVWGYLALICLQVSAQPATPAASLIEQGGLLYWHLFASLKNMV